MIFGLKVRCSAASAGKTDPISAATRIIHNGISQIL